MDIPEGELSELAPHEPIENLVFEGGGVKGIVYVGALEVLEQQKVLAGVKRVGGSSAGGITALLVGLGFTVDEVKEIMGAMDFTKFQDGSDEFWRKIPKELDFTKLGVKAAKKIESVLKVIKGKKHGVFKGDVFLEWARGMIAEKLGNPDATFADLRRIMKENPELGLKEMMFTGTNISGNGPPLQYFDADNTPNVRIADAVRATMSFPGAFEAYDIEINGVVSTFVDGGLANNYPIEYYNRQELLPEGVHLNALGVNPRVLGFKVDTMDEISRFKWGLRDDKAANTDGMLGFASGMVGAVTSDRVKVYNHGFNTVQIHDKGVSTLNFELTKEEQNMLRQQGMDDTRAHFDMYRRNAAAERRIYNNLGQKYQEMAKTAPGREALASQRDALVEKIRSQAPRAEAEARSSEEIRNIISELNLIDRTLRGYQKKPEEELVGKVSDLLKLQEKLAEINQIELENIMGEFDATYNDLKKLHEAHQANVKVLEDAMKAENPIIKITLQKVFDEIKRINDNITLLQAKILSEENEDKKRSLEMEILKLKNKGAEIFSQFASVATVDNFVNAANIKINQEQLAIFHALIRNEINQVLTKTSVKPRTLEEFQNYLKTTANESGARLKGLDEFRIKHRKIIEKNRSNIEKFMEQRAATGKNLRKMLELYNELTDFTHKQNSLGTFLCKALRVASKILFLPLYGIYYGIRTGIKKWSKPETYAKLRKFENIFYTNQELYLKYATRLKDDMRHIMKNWSKAGATPISNMEIYDRILASAQKTAEHGQYRKLFFKESKADFMNLLGAERKRVGEERKVQEERAAKAQAADQFDISPRSNAAELISMASALIAELAAAKPHEREISAAHLENHLKRFPKHLAFAHEYFEQFAKYINLKNDFFKNNHDLRITRIELGELRKKIKSEKEEHGQESDAVKKMDKKLKELEERARDLNRKIDKNKADLNVINQQISEILNTAAVGRTSKSNILDYLKAHFHIKGFFNKQTLSFDKKKSGEDAMLKAGKAVAEGLISEFEPARTLYTSTLLETVGVVEKDQAFEHHKKGRENYNIDSALYMINKSLGVKLRVANGEDIFQKPYEVERNKFLLGIPNQEIVETLSEGLKAGHPLAVEAFSQFVSHLVRSAVVSLTKDPNLAFPDTKNPEQNSNRAKLQAQQTQLKQLLGLASTVVEDDKIKDILRQCMQLGRDKPSQDNAWNLTKNIDKDLSAFRERLKSILAGTPSEKLMLHGKALKAAGSKSSLEPATAPEKPKRDTGRPDGL